MPQSLNHYYSITSLIESNFEILNDMEFELESIMIKEFAQGLPNDLDNHVV
ncbi:hypothetical protein SAMD00079811_76610 (plasmid) [Scytonema sp. HK-05]|uniref:hypothetical protein n=1 Tax=Scytonema sp. HK-05 TaxID=1137095 RepID=UPI000B19EB53|nr:hypothetical protein [Scytonema sp. HK-05]BAY50032.1 hypothetical protein SAMD00079811_76610 [Scytonema sp. HK-05]